MTTMEPGQPPSTTSSDAQREEPSTLPSFTDRLLTSSVTKIQLLRLAMKGLNATEAAKVVGCHVATARSYYADPEFRQAVMAKVDAAFADVDAAYTRKRKSLHEMIEEQAYRSCEDLIDMLENPDLHPSLRAKINQDFLNRVEDGAQVQKFVRLDSADLSLAAKAAEEMDNVIQMKKKVG